MNKLMYELVTLSRLSMRGGRKKLVCDVFRSASIGVGNPENSKLDDAVIRLGADEVFSNVREGIDKWFLGTTTCKPDTIVALVEYTVSPDRWDANVVDVYPLPRSAVDEMVAVARRICGIEKVKGHEASSNGGLGTQSVVAMARER